MYKTHDLTKISKLNLVLPNELDMLTNFKDAKKSWSESLIGATEELFCNLSECKHSPDNRLRALYYIFNVLYNNRSVSYNFLEINSENSFSDPFKINELFDKMYHSFLEIDLFNLNTDLPFSFVESPFLDSIYIAFIKPNDIHAITTMLRLKFKSAIDDGINLDKKQESLALFEYTSHQDISRFIEQLDTLINNKYLKKLES
jgi:hypothetical protein